MMACLKPIVESMEKTETGESTPLSYSYSYGATPYRENGPERPCYRGPRVLSESSAASTSSVRLTTMERAKLTFTPRRCRLKWTRSKGAVLVLLWNCLIANNHGPFSSITAGILGLDKVDQMDANYINIINSVIQGVCFTLFYPLAGWIADAYVGRYKVIHTSLFMMWGGTIAIAVCLCIQRVTGISLTPFQYSIFPLSLLVVQLGIAGFKANAIPFGTDQLMDSSGEELSAYIHWYVFAIFVNIRLLSVPFPCFVESPDSILLFQLLVQAASTSIALALDFSCRHWLVIEPKSTNPFKLIYRVLNYARRNKHARRRSAFTYNREEPPTRLELAKEEYGGPFEFEQVEDVKTFLRMISVLLPMGLVFLMQVVIYQSGALLINHTPSNLDCFPKDVLGKDYPFLLIFFLIPLFELVLYPFLHNLLPSMLTRAAVGTVLLIGATLSQLIIEIVGRLDSHSLSFLTHTNASDAQSTCLFANDAIYLDVDFMWTAIPSTLLALGILFQFVAVNEFVFAQSPYSMKGLFIGLIYGIQGFFQLIVLVPQLPFLLGAANSTHNFPTCGFYYCLMNTIIAAAATVWYCGVARKYKKRQRDSPDSYHIFTEEYFDKYLRYN